VVGAKMTKNKNNNKVNAVKAAALMLMKASKSTKQKQNKKDPVSFTTFLCRLSSFSPYMLQKGGNSFHWFLEEGFVLCCHCKLYCSHTTYESTSCRLQEGCTLGFAFSPKMPPGLLINLKVIIDQTVPTVKGLPCLGQ